MASKKASEGAPLADCCQRDALEREYRDHSTWLMGVARRGLGSADDAEDVVHEAYIRAARYPAQSRSSPRHLLASIVRNLIRDKARARSRESAGRRSLVDLGAELVATHGDQHSILALKRIVLEMPSTYREVFLLSRFTALSQGEIAARLGISVKTVEWRLAKALAYCAERIGE